MAFKRLGKIVEKDSAVTRKTRLSQGCGGITTSFYMVACLMVWCSCLNHLTGRLRVQQLK